ncbi:type II toxin-antitoxin system ParD family antitoxin [Pseudomonas sp. R1-15]|uniref:type II toxin-antitoxin system ParD family antitoxin n=1 Tax=Pseudomonas sp. R1-15 TaxID=2817399 RepID=UPI003DA86588
MATRNVVLTPHQEQVIHDLVKSGRYQNASEVMREGLRLLEQRVAEDTAKIEALRQATSIGIMDLEHGRFTQVTEGDDLEHYLEGLSLEATLPAREKH